MERNRTAETDPSEATGEAVRLWLVERTYAADEHNIVLVYATLGGERYVRKNRTRRILAEPTTAAIDASPDRLEAVADPDRRERYAAEAKRMAARRDPDDEV